MATLDFIGNPNIRNILFMAEVSGECVAVSTFCRKHNRRGRFLLIRERLRELLNEAPRDFYDMDCNNHVHIHAGMNRWTFTFDWLSEYSDGTLTGFRQTIEVPSSAMTELFEDGTPVRYLFAPREAHARVDSSHVGNSIREILGIPRVRRAFAKAMRDCFRWRDDEVTLYRDFGTSFFFRTRSGCPECGGLILHESTRKTPKGTFPEMYYGVHT